MRTVESSAGQAVYQDFIVAPNTCVPAKRLHAVFTVDSALGQQRLQAAIRQVVATHDALRTSLELVDRKWVQVIREVPEVDETPWSAVAWDGTATGISELVYSMDDWWTVTRQLSIRVLYGFSPQGRTLVACFFSHACGDGMSADLVAEQIRTAYDQPANGLSPGRPEQFTAYYRKMVQHGANLHDEWLDLIRTSSPAVPQWMIERKLAAETAWVRILEWDFSPENAALLNQLARTYRCSPFEALAACAGLYFRRDDGRPAGFGVIHSGRHRPDGFDVVGLLRSYVVDVVDLDSCVDVQSAIATRCRELRARLGRFSGLPFEEVCRQAEISPGWRAGSLGLWEVELNGMYESTDSAEVGGHAVDNIPVDITDEAFCEMGGPIFLLYFTFGPGKVHTTLRYIDPPVSVGLAQQIAADFEAVVAFVAGNPERPPAEAPSVFATAPEVGV